jgi:hypothetical protein
MIYPDDLQPREADSSRVADAQPPESDETLEPDGPSLDEAAIADDFSAGTDAPLGRAGVDRALANG